MPIQRAIFFCDKRSAPSFFLLDTLLRCLPDDLHSLFVDGHRLCRRAGQTVTLQQVHAHLQHLAQLRAQAVQMGTRFVLSEECIAHENYKNAVLKAKDRATVMTGLTTGHPVRIIDNSLAHKYKNLEFSGGSKEELEALGAGTLRKAAIDGDVKEGSVMIGQISGMLTDIKPCATIINDIMTETETVIKNLQGLNK